MANGGRISGRVNGENYELVQDGTVRQIIPISDIDAKFKKAIERNRWEPLP